MKKNLGYVLAFGTLSIAVTGVMMGTSSAYECNVTAGRVCDVAGTATCAVAVASDCSGHACGVAVASDCDSCAQAVASNCSAPQSPPPTPTATPTAILKELLDGGNN